MSEKAACRRLADGRRLHLSHGPIDIILAADGVVARVDDAYAAAFARFQTILEELCSELPLLRTAADRLPGAPAGAVARRMVAAVAPYARQAFITPMAAVAGAVAEEVLAAMTAAQPGLERIYVNNGGDIALHLAPAAHFDVGIVDDPQQPRLAGTARIHGLDAVRGIATSGWRGRSFSLGIADAVTVLAASASAADAAATIIGNAVDLPGHAAVVRAPARSRQPDSDLGERLVTIAVGPLSRADAATALRRGRAAAEELRVAGLITGAALLLDGQGASTGCAGLALQARPAAHRAAA